ncbi:unnamed protein product, partial [Timema podura]|nr:unnamed protein product [Timema podura]
KIKEHKKVKKEKEKDKDKVKRKKNKKDKVKTEKKLKTNKKVKSPSGKKNKTEKKKDKPLANALVVLSSTAEDEEIEVRISVGFIKPVIKKESETDQPQHFPSTEDVAPKRVESPELARISALLTRPPKPKSSSKTPLPKPELCLDTVVPSPSISSAGPSLKKSETKQIHKKITSIVDPPKEPLAFYYVKLNPETRVDFPANVAQQVTAAKAGPSKLQDTLSADADGNKVWICPACGGKDDGSPMIGCDHCDAWYHCFVSHAFTVTPFVLLLDKIIISVFSSLMCNPTFLAFFFCSKAISLPSPPSL